MFKFLKRITTPPKDENDMDARQNCNTQIASGYSASSVAQQAAQQASRTFAKPPYTGNRQLYDSGAAKRNLKAAQFQDGVPVIDPYTGERLMLRKQDAKLLYGNDWQKHLAEADHIKPLAKATQDANNSFWGNWNTIADEQRAFNSPDNIRVTSREFNNAKRSRTNQEFVGDDIYLHSKGINLTEEGRQQAIRDGKFAEDSINQQLAISGISNMARTAHNAGMMGAQAAGTTSLTMSGIMNVVSVIRGEKTSDQAIADTLRDGGSAAVSGYAMTGGLTVVQHSLSNSSSQFIQSLSASNVPGRVITAVMATGDTLAKWGNGEITTQQCLIELGDKGLNLATTGYSMAVGQALIPIPVVGGAVGALVGSVLTSNYYHNLINTLQMRELEHQERQRIIAECRQAAEQTKKFRTELESYLQSYFREYRNCFDTAISSMKFAYQSGDADGVIASANAITRKLGGKVHYETVDEFRAFLTSDVDDEW